MQSLTSPAWVQAERGWPRQLVLSSNLVEKPPRVVSQLVV